MTGLKSEKTDLKRLQRAFEAMDTNKDGTLTRDEFLQATKEIQAMRFKEKENTKWDEVF